jgi:hypothetical protein
MKGALLEHLRDFIGECSRKTCDGLIKVAPSKKKAFGHTPQLISKKDE